MSEPLPSAVPAIPRIHHFPETKLSAPHHNLADVLECPKSRARIVKSGDIDLTVESDRMIIIGEKKLEHEKKEGNCYLMERSYGSLRRNFVLPAQAGADKVAACYRDGILTVTVPKTEVAKGKRIDITSS